MAKTKVLFLCTGNSARSLMAEAFLRKLAADRFEAFSAGLEPKGINPFTCQVMEEVGIDLAGLRSKDVTEYLGKVNFGYLITVCDHAEKNCPTTFLGVSNRLHWSLEDPAAFQGSDEQTLAKFRQVRDDIDRRMQAWLASQPIAA
jgi:arsenate reductase